MSGCWPKTDSSTTKSTAAIPPFFRALDQLGGSGTRGPPLDFFLPRLRARDCASARLRGRPRAGRVSIRPPWVPRCLRRRFFLVCAIECRLAEHVLDHVALRVEVLDRRVVRITLERGLWREPDQLRLDRTGAVLGGESLDLGDDLRERHIMRVVNVDRDLTLPRVARKAQGSDAAKTATRLPQS